MDARKVLLLRVYLVAFGFGIFALLVCYQLLKVSWYEGPEWRAKSERMYVKNIEVEGDRGNIISANGLPLATSMQFFDIRMDLNTQALTDNVFYTGIDSLSYYLSRYVDPSKSPVQFRNHLIQRRKAGERYLLLKRNATYEELNLIKNFPILRKGQFRGGLIVERKSRRVKPFRSLASRTIGIDRPNATNVGIEEAFDTQLRGDKGNRVVQRISNSNWIPLDDLAHSSPQSGTDVVSTINTDIQDVVHSALQKALEHHQASFGVAIVMRTKTGEISAISNLERKSGSFIETYNHAIGTLIEPGSLFKLGSILALLEDEMINVDDEVYLNKGKGRICDKIVRDSEPHEHQIATIKEAFEISSNVGISKLVYEKYQLPNREPDFLKRIRQFGLDKQTGIEIKGEAVPYIKEAGNLSEGWSCLSLPWMSFGYELSMTPLQILTFYNAVANGGKMMKPYLVSELRRDGKLVRSFKPEVLDRAIASPKNIQIAKELLEGVVENGTGYRVKSKGFQVAGKSGTTQLNYTDPNRSKTNYQSSFAGYFPAEDPDYTCLVLISEPTRNGFYGGTVAGPVFKEIAEKIRAIQPDRHPVSLEESGLIRGKLSYPFWQVGNANDMTYLFNELGFFPEADNGMEYCIVMPGEKGDFSLKTRSVSSDVVPNVVGMGLRDALFVLEKAGINAKIDGYGRVVQQSVVPGSAIKNDRTMKLILDI